MKMKQVASLSSRNNFYFVRRNPACVSNIYNANFTSSSNKSDTNGDEIKKKIKKSSDIISDPSSHYLKNLMRSPSSWETPDVQPSDKKGWQPNHNLDIQRVTQMAIVSLIKWIR